MGLLRKITGPSLDELAEMELARKHGHAMPNNPPTQAQNINARSKANKKGKGVAVIVIILVLIFVAVLTNNSSNSKIDLDKFNKIETGMTYKEVVDVIGEEGEMLSQVDVGIGNEYKTETYLWYGSNKIANANVTFQGDKVTMKAQIGLN